MSCCPHLGATAAHFGTARATGDLRRYRERGPDPTTRLLLEEIRATGLHDAELLDLGGGIGVLHHELLDGTVRRAVQVEAAPAYVAAAQDEDRRRGHADRVRYVTGNAVAAVDPLPAADLVTLDRVICCYPDWELLVRSSAGKSRRLYGFSVPHDRWYVRLMTGIENLVRRIRGNRFRTFVHPVAGVARLLGEMGFHPVSVRRSLVWHVAIYVRTDSR